MYSHVTTLSFTVIYEKIELLKGHLLSFVVSYHLFVFFNNTNTVSAEKWVWGFGNHAWYKSPVKSRVEDFCIACDFQNPILTFPTHSIHTMLSGFLVVEMPDPQIWNFFDLTHRQWPLTEKMLKFKMILLFCQKVCFQNIKIKED